MKYFRIILTGICFISFGLGSFVVGCVLFPLIWVFNSAQKQQMISVNIIRKLWKFFVWFICFCRLIEVKVINKKLLYSLKGKIIVANHPSLIDIVLLISLIPNAVCIVKGKLAHNFFMKQIVKRVYLLNNEDPCVLMDKACEFLNRGFNVIIFPEGTRTDFTLVEQKLYRGFAHLAIHSKANILPINIQSTPHILGKNQKWYDMGVSTVIYQIFVYPQIIVCKNEQKSNHIRSKELVECVKLKIFNSFANN